MSVSACFSEFLCISWVGGSCRLRRRSCSSRSPAGVVVNPRQPAEARSSTAHTSEMQECSLGSRPITLTRRRVSPKVRSIRVAHTSPMLTREPQADRQRFAVVKQGAHRRGVGVAPAFGELIDPMLGSFHRFEAGLDILRQVEDRPVIRFDLGLCVFRYLGKYMRTRWIKQR
jgi:hypothetical protein